MFLLLCVPSPAAFWTCLGLDGDSETCSVDYVAPPEDGQELDGTDSASAKAAATARGRSRTRKRRGRRRRSTAVAAAKAAAAEGVC